MATVVLFKRLISLFIYWQIMTHLCIAIKLSRQKRIVWIGVQYKKNVQPTVAPVVTETAIPTYPHICSPDFVPQVFSQTSDGNTFVFSGEHYWKIMDFDGNVVDNRQTPGQSIVQDWPGMPNNVDAAVTLADGTTVFFKDDQFFVFWNKMPKQPLVGTIESAFPLIPSSKLDAAFMTNTSLIFIKENSFYVFGIEQFPFVQRGNLVDMGLPSLPVESAVNLSDGLAYVIIDKTAYQVDTLTLQVISSFPTQSLYGCLEPLMSSRNYVRLPYGRRFHPDKNDFRTWTSAFLPHFNAL